MATKKVFYNGNRATIHSVAGEIRPGENILDEGIANQLILDGVVQEIVKEEDSYMIAPEDYSNDIRNNESGECITSDTIINTTTAIKENKVKKKFSKKDGKA